MRSGKARGIRPHRRQSRRIVEQPIDLPGERRQVVPTDRDPMLKEMVGVPLLLARNGADDDQREAACQGLGACQAPGKSASGGCAGIRPLTSERGPCY